LVALGALVLDHHERDVQLEGDRNHLAEEDDERLLLLAGVDLGAERLDELGGAQESVEVAEHERGRSIERGQDVPHRIAASGSVSVVTGVTSGICPDIPKLRSTS
jgi:hypothetical protein